MSIDIKTMLGEERLAVLKKRYQECLETLDDPNAPQVTVFNPLNSELLYKLNIVRAVSKYIQQKKDKENVAEAANKVDEPKTAVEENTEKPKEQESSTNEQK